MAQVLSACAPVLHPTAVVDPRAAIDRGVQIGPYCVVAARCTIGSGTVLESHVVVCGGTTVGNDCRIHPFAVLGGPPQDRKYHDEETELVIGDGVVVREHVTVHRGTAAGSGRTEVGARSLLMAHTHVAHDCKLGVDVVMANGATLAGHVTVGDHAVFGGLSAVGQFLRVGESAMVAAGSMVEQDVPPFCTVGGDRAKVRALNVVGLRRRSVAPDSIVALRRAYRLLFRETRPIGEAIEAIRRTVPSTPEVERLLAFASASSRGLCR